MPTPLALAASSTPQTHGLGAALLLSLCVVPFVGELMVSLRRPIFYDRTLIWTTLPFYLLMAIGIRGVMVGAAGQGRAFSRAHRAVHHTRTNAPPGHRRAGGGAGFSA
ncbi:MAG: hypothetical protein R2838_12995 [Caldilineaceae bacterium]